MYSPEKTELDNLLMQFFEDYRAGDKVALDHIIEHLMPYCLSICSKICGKYINENDDEASIARMAIVEALYKFEPEKGSHMVFLGRVIRSRIIDYKRKEKKYRLIPFTFLSRNGNTFEDGDDDFFEDILDDLARKQEIQRFQTLLKDFNICFNDLAEASPRQQKSKQDANKIAYIISKEPQLYTYLMEKRMLPLKELEDHWFINRKIADRYRKYIIAVSLIHLNDFPMLKSYLLPLQGGDENVS